MNKQRAILPRLGVASWVSKKIPRGHLGVEMPITIRDCVKYSSSLRPSSCSNRTQVHRVALSSLHQDIPFSFLYVACIHPPSYKSFQWSGFIFNFIYSSYRGNGGDDDEDDDDEDVDEDMPGLVPCL